MGAMKVKCLFFILFSFLFLTLWGETMNSEIEMTRWNGEERSVFSLPKVTHDGNLFHIYSELPLKNLQIQILDLEGNTVFSDYTSMVQSYSFVVSNLEVGNYSIELRQEKRFLRGYFTIY